MAPRIEQSRLKLISYCLYCTDQCSGSLHLVTFFAPIVTVGVGDTALENRGDIGDRHESWPTDYFVLRKKRKRKCRKSDTRPTRARRLGLRPRPPGATCVRYVPGQAWLDSSAEGGCAAGREGQSGPRYGVNVVTSAPAEVISGRAAFVIGGFGSARQQARRACYALRAPCSVMLRQASVRLLVCGLWRTGQIACARDRFAPE